MKVPDTRLLTDVDAPLRDVSRDALARSAYASRVAQIIQEWRGEQSFVIAIYGEWGSGKTTFKNFVTARLNLEIPKPIVVEFNPWEWEGQQQLTEAFFQEIAYEIGESGVKRADEVSERLSRYGVYLSVGSTIAGSAGLIVPSIAPATTPLAAVLQKAGKLVKGASSAKLKQKSLKTLRDELIKSIRALDRTIVVVLDDVDRLTAQETALLFQLLKANADFPRVVYLLLCDRDVVALNLQPVVGERSDQFLEKIVQLGLHLPKAYPEQIRNIVIDGVTRFADDVTRDGSFDRDRFANVYDEFASTYFRTLRDVKRFLAGIAGVLPAICSDGQPNVNLCDFFLLEVLRVFEYSMYEQLYRSRDKLVGFMGMPSEETSDPFPDLRQAARLSEAAIGIWHDLFPRFSSTHAVPRHDRNAIDRANSFDRYFLFGVPTDQYSNAEAELVLARRASPMLIADLCDARSAGRLSALLDILTSTDPPEAPEARVQFLVTLADFAEQLHLSDGAERGGTSYRQVIDFFAWRALIPAADNLEREDFLREVFRRTNGLRFVTSMVKFFENPLAREGDQSKSRLTKDLASIALEKVRSAPHRLLAAHPGIAEILEWWAKRERVDRITEFIALVVKEDATLLDLLSSFSYEYLSNTGHRRLQRLGRRSFVSALESYVPVEEVLSRLGQIDASRLSYEQRRLIKAWIRNIHEHLTTATAPEPPLEDQGRTECHDDTTSQNLSDGD